MQLDETQLPELKSIEKGAMQRAHLEVVATKHDSHLETRVLPNMQSSMAQLVDPE